MKSAVRPTYSASANALGRKTSYSRLRLASLVQQLQVLRNLLAPWAHIDVYDGVALRVMSHAGTDSDHAVEVPWRERQTPEVGR